MPGVKAILPTLRRRLSTGDIFKPARKLVKLSLHIRKDFITRVASKNVWVILAPSNGLIIIMNWFQKVSLNKMSGKVLTSLRQVSLILDWWQAIWAQYCFAGSTKQALHR